MEQSLWAPKFNKGHRGEHIHDSDFREMYLREEGVASDEWHPIKL